jgi:hypothetical protein
MSCAFFLLAFNRKNNTMKDFKYRFEWVRGGRGDGAPPPDKWKTFANGELAIPLFYTAIDETDSLDYNQNTTANLFLERVNSLLNSNRIDSASTGSTLVNTSFELDPLGLYGGDVNFLASIAKTWGKSTWKIFDGFFVGQVTLYLFFVLEPIDYEF